MAVAQERRTQSAMSEVVDGALDLADHCGWRYALAYLIHHGVSEGVIQRLLSGAKVRRRQAVGSVAYCRIRTWKGSGDEEMAKLFDLLQQRHAGTGSARLRRQANDAPTRMCNEHIF